MSDSPGLELQGSHEPADMDAGSWTQVLWKHYMHTQKLSYSLQLLFFLSLAIASATDT